MISAVLVLGGLVLLAAGLFGTTVLALWLLRDRPFQ